MALRLVKEGERAHGPRIVLDEEGISARQRGILHYIQEQVRSRGYPPTIREICVEVGIRSTNGVAEHLEVLIRQGYLEKQGMKSRTLMPTSKGRALLGEAWPELQGSVEVPLLGRVAAGQPILAEENVEDVVRLDSYFLGGGSKVFALRVVGDSMIGDGILDGDCVFVRQQETAEAGEIVVAIVEGEATVKRYYPEGDRIRLQPSNPDMAPIYLRRVDARRSNLAGVVVGVYRQLR
jgi:repressor LexA